MYKKIIFITGVSSGFGKDLLTEAAKSGHTVIGTVRKKDQIETINQILPGKTFGVLLDVNQHDKVREALQHIIDRFGKIDVVINNAGYGIMGAVEEISMEEARMQMETNFFGALAVTQAAIPHMRKQQFGHILQFSSIAGIISTPGLGLYNASKYALEGLSEALRMELSPLNIHVTLVEPGPFRTLWAGPSLQIASKTIVDYKNTAHKTKETVSGFSGKQPGDPVMGSKAILQIIEAKNPPLRLLLGKIAVQRVKQKIQMLEEDMMQWEELSISADYAK